MPQKVSQQEYREKEGQVGIRPDREQVVGQLWEKKQATENMNVDRHSVLVQSISHCSIKTEE